MTEAFFQTIRYCFPVVFFAALPGSRRTEEGGSCLNLPIWVGGIAAGGVLALLYVTHDVRSLAEGIVMLAATPFLGAMLLPGAVAGKVGKIACRAAALLVMGQRTAALASFVLYKSLDRVNVLNTEFLLFHGGIAFGIALLATAGVALSRLAADNRHVTRAIVAAAVIVLLVGEHLAWGYYALVLAGWVTLPDSLFAPVVFIVNHIQYFGYAQMVLAAVFGAGCFLFRAKPEAGRMTVMNPASRRKYLWKLRSQWRTAVVFLAAAGVTAGVSVYYKAYASRPPRLSPAQHLEASEGRLVIPVRELEPGDFRRYAFTDGEGHVIRFIVLKDEVGTIRTAYDACLFCGSKGYLKQGKDLVCLACGAAIYAPTVGRDGGCNPIPLAHSINDGALVIAVETLVKGDGARFFSGTDGAHS